MSGCLLIVIITFTQSHLQRQSLSSKFFCTGASFKNSLYHALYCAEPVLWTPDIMHFVVQSQFYELPTSCTLLCKASFMNSPHHALCCAKPVLWTAHIMHFVVQSQFYELPTSCTEWVFERRMAYATKRTGILVFWALVRTHDACTVGTVYTSVL